MTLQHPFQPTRSGLQSILTHALKQLPFAEQSLWQVRDYHSVSGGDISQSYLLYTYGPPFFLKLNDSSKLPLFRAESYGLNHLLKTRTIRSCHPFAFGHVGDHAYLLLEGLELSEQGDWHLAGRQLAQLHQADAGQRYGFEHETFCGKSAQPNDWEENWGHFFAVKRIGQQLTRLYKKRLNDPKISQVIDHIRRLVANHQPQPSLLHGDLWHGNIAFTEDKPVIFDPACYIGDRETDIAMSELFGRLPQDFYQGYAQQAPLSENYPQRRPIYQLYHLLNHANLFGGSYKQQAERMLADIMAQQP